MIFLSILIFIVAIALPSFNRNISSVLYLRIISLIFIYAGALSFNAFYIQSIGSGIGIYSGFFQITLFTQLFDIFIVFIAVILLLRDILYKSAIFKIKSIKSKNLDLDNSVLTINNNRIKFSLIVLVSILGSILLLSSSDLIFIFLNLALCLIGLAIIILYKLNKLDIYVIFIILYNNWIDNKGFNLFIKFIGTSFIIRLSHYILMTLGIIIKFLTLIVFKIINLNFFKQDNILNFYKEIINLATQDNILIWNKEILDKYLVILYKNLVILDKNLVHIDLFEFFNNIYDKIIGFIHHVITLSLFEASMICHIILLLTICYSALNIMFSLFGDSILKWLNLEKRYPKLASIIHYRRFFMNYYNFVYLSYIILISLGFIILDIIAIA